MDYAQEQADELEALTSIFADDLEGESCTYRCPRHHKRVAAPACLTPPFSHTARCRGQGQHTVGVEPHGSGVAGSGGAASRGWAGDGDPQ